MRRRRATRDPETGEWIGLPICPSCELVLTTDGRDCRACQHSRRHPNIPNPDAHAAAWATPPKDFT